jgi:hypothetical protein
MERQKILQNSLKDMGTNYGNKMWSQNVGTKCGHKVWAQNVGTKCGQKI